MSHIKPEHEREFGELLGIFDKALRSFHYHDRYLLKIDVSEQCLCGRLAYHLQNALAGTEYESYDVDCEYNRGMQAKDGSVKKVDGGCVRLDIAVHKRHYDHQNHCYWNLMCVEMKKRNGRKQAIEDDKGRLLQLTRKVYGFGYKAAFFVVADKENLKVENVYSSLSEDNWNTEIENYWRKNPA